MQLTLDLEEDDVPAVLKGLRNEAARLRVINRSGDVLERLADQIEQAAVKKPVQREITKRKEKRA